MGYEGLAPVVIGGGEKRINVLLEWVNSDCRNKLCIGGGVSIDDGKSCTYYRCPLCARSPVLSAKVYPGPIELWTEEEMAARLKDRKDVYFDKDYRYKRGLEIVGLLKSLTGGKTDGPF